MPIRRRVRGARLAHRETCAPPRACCQPLQEAAKPELFWPVFTPWAWPNV